VTVCDPRGQRPAPTADAEKKINALFKAVAQAWNRAVSVPGRALAGVVKLLPASGLTPESHRLLVDYHADVVQLLTSEGARLSEIKPGP
jgi:hypothetical protein